MMARRPHSAEAARRLPSECEIHGIEDTTGACAGRIPRSLANDCVGVETAATGERHLMDRVDVTMLVG
jgi:hypothetical protein